MESTIEAGDVEGARSPELPIPGLVLVFLDTDPCWRCIPLGEGGVEIGRGRESALQLEDTALSRQHARISFRDGVWTIEDLASRNGTFVDAQPVTGLVRAAAPRVIRAGRTVFLACADVRPYRRAGVDLRDGLVVGPTLASVLASVAQVAALGRILHISGESGAGKEVAARAFHRAAGARTGPLVAVNCAAIPAGLAERLLFGARKGAFSGADADAEGYLQAADKGTLFLDEVGDLDLGVQAKLLRVLESAEVIPLGGTRPQRVDLRVCSATLHSLRARVSRKEFREDLYYRLGKPEVIIPPLRERLEEIPWLISAEIPRVHAGLRPKPRFVEAALLRRWPGNVRELIAEVRQAARAALLEGEMEVDARHLHADAGREITGPAPPPVTPDPTPGALEPGRATTDPAAGAPADRRRLIEETLRREEGNVSRTAQALGLHRTKLRRLLERYAIDAHAFAPPGVQARRAKGEE
jgi:DNA-binding NtrC family response regulator